MNHYIMLQRNLIYTSITRAKKILVLVGTKKALHYAIRNVTVQKRNTMLRERICKNFQDGSQANKVIQGTFSYYDIHEGEDSGMLKVAEETPAYGAIEKREGTILKNDKKIQQ